MLLIIGNLYITDIDFQTSISKYSIVTYSRVLFRWNFTATPKLNKLQLHSQQLFEHTYASNLYSLGTLTPIEFVQQNLFWSSSNTNWPSKAIQSHRQQNSTVEINYSLFTLLHDNGTKAAQYCCVTKETQRCTTVLLRNRAPTSRCYGNHNTQQY
jgi:hypothetical protein